MADGKFSVKVADVKDIVQQMYKHNAKTKENFVNMGSKRISACSLEGVQKDQVDKILKILNGQIEKLFDGVKRIADNLFSYCDDIEDYNKKDLFAEVEAQVKKTANNVKTRPARKR